MALVREPMVYNGFDAGEASAFDALGYGHGELLDVDAAALFGGNVSEPAGACSANWAFAGASVLEFDLAARGHGAVQAAAAEEEECDAWIDAMDQSYGAAATQHATAAIGFDAASGCFSLKERAGGAGRAFGLLFPSTSSVSPDAAAPARRSQKRPHVAAEPLAISPTKKQGGASRMTSKAKSAPTTPPKDPQSLAAKNRRERISERLQILQELVPNGTKVDLVTMLEKAISYVKFLQLQVKVLATDEFWPAQGGKAPEISQVKEALDAILSSSQRGQLN